jgi:hypothetical protein
MKRSILILTQERQIEALIYIAINKESLLFEIFSGSKKGRQPVIWQMMLSN